MRSTCTSVAMSYGHEALQAASPSDPYLERVHSMESAQKAPYRVSGGALMMAAAQIVQPRCRVNVLDAPGADWDPFVMGFPDSSLYHLTGWTEIAHEVFGHRGLFVEARDSGGALVGVLPAVQQRSWLLGNFATSLAFF